VARINLIGWRNQAGLSRDLGILAETLAAAGHQVHVNGLTPPRRLQRMWVRLLSGGPRWELAVFVERVVPSWMEMAKRNILIANPEWLEVTAALSRVSAVFCKSQAGLEALQGLGLPLELTGFSSLDRRPGPVGDGHRRHWRRPLHIAGRNKAKGTTALLQAWWRHPEWPTLTLVAHREKIPIPAGLPSNIQLIDHFLDDASLNQLQLECGLHLCPSAVEGFGHTLVEGMSTGAVVLTTDAPPMNEIVTAERGVLVPWCRTESMRLGHRYEVDPTILEAVIARTFDLSDSRLAELGERARTWFEANDRAFRERLVAAVERLLRVA
jgi:glycosyltransferase involved in cell wall biosynthesis